ncbi:hypothetical protein EC991_008655 [Linnemannia zychae]|nr:hypothetical protein EC991_008655 [Linnemannia zychae]
MKVPTIIAALIAVAFTAPVFAAPARPINGTLTDDEAFFASRVVDYNYKEMAAIAAKYDEVVHGSKALTRSNAVSKAAAVSSDIIPFCVGYASNPVRVRVFRNKLTCAIQGWVTLYTFTAHTKKDDYLAAEPLCVGLAENPTRSMYFSKKTSCSEAGWTTDHSFYVSTNVFKRVNMWQAEGPHRMLVYPEYPGADHGWHWAYTQQTRSIFRPAADNELKTFKSEYVLHLEVHKKLSIASIPDAKTLRCVSLMIEHTSHKAITLEPFSLPGRNIVGYSADAYDAKCSDLVLKSTIELSRINVGGYGAMEVQINKKTYAAITLSMATEANPYLYRTALLESLRSGQPVIVTKNDKFDAATSIIAYFQGTAFATGDSGKFWNANI